MLIIERRTSAVLAALGVSTALVVFGGGMSDRRAEREVQPSAASMQPLADSAGSGAEANPPDVNVAPGAAPVGRH
jgi:hypothetical protein